MMVGCRGPRRSSVHFRNISSRRSTIDQAFQFRPSAKIRADVTVSVVFFLHSFRRVFFYVLARSANLPKGLYILLMFFLILKIFFNDRLSNTCFSDANGSIFTKISGLVDECKGLFTSIEFFVSQGALLWQLIKVVKSKLLSGPIYINCAAIPKRIAISQYL